jgi:hypothetical protein
VVAGLEQVQQVRRRGQARAEGEAVRAALERGQVLLERLARGVL